MSELHTMRLLASLALLGAALTVHAQQCDWLVSAPITYTSNPSMANEVLASAPGMLIGARQSSGVFIYGQNLYGEAVIERRDQVTGEQSWWCPLFDSVNVQAAVVGADGRAYFAGRFMGTLGLCDGSVLGSVPGQHPWYENSFLIAVDLNDGVFLWTRNLSLEHPDASGVSGLAIDPQGHLWYAVSEWGVGKVMRVDGQGADMETRAIDGVRLLGGISFDPWGGLYVSGSASDTGFAFGGQSYQDYNSSGYAMFVLRYKPDGTAGFAAFGTDITFQDPVVVATSDGHAYLSGGLLDGTQWGDIPFNGPDWGMSVFLTKLDSTGQFLWGVESDLPGGTITGDMDRAKGPCIAVDASDNVYLMGTVRGEVDWGSGVVSGGGTTMDRRLSIAAFDPSGAPQWAANSQPVGLFGEARAVTASADEAVHFAGHINGGFDFVPHNTNADGAQAALFGRLDGLVTGIGPHLDGEGPHIAPNPVADVLTIVLDDRLPMQVELLTITGRQISTLQLVPGVNTLEVGELCSGVYLLRTPRGTMRIVKD